MKRIIAFLLALTFCAVIFAGCKTNPDPAQTTTAAPDTEKVDTLENAKQYLYAMYKDAAEKTLKPFKRVGIVTISGEVFDVEWTAKVLTGPEDGIKIVAGDKTVTIEMNETPEEELRYELTATVRKGEESKSVTFTHYVPAVPKAGGIEVVKEVKTDTPFKFGLVQGNLEKTLFFAGTMSGNYLATTEDAMAAEDVYVEAVEGGYRLYFFAGETKTYIDLHEYKEGKAGIRLTTEPTATFVWNEELHIFTTNVAGEDRYLGTYNTFNTISASATSYITGDNASKIGVSQFPAYLYKVEIKKAVVTEVATDTAFKFGLVQGNLEKTLFFSGKMSGNYLATTESIAKAADVFVEAVEGGYRLYFFEGETKTYIDLHEYKEGKAGIRLTTEPTATFVWNEELHLFTTNVAGEDRYLGTYNTFNTISASATSYITGDNASKIGVSQFPAQLYMIEYTRNVATEVVAGKAYKFSLVQGNLEKTLYFSGAMSGNYLATTTNAAAAVDVFVEAVEGGYRLYFMAGETKTYIDLHEYKEGKAGIRLTTEPTATFVWNEELHIFTTNVAGEDRYLGTYNTFNTISASATSYITGDNAAKIGVSQFPAQLVTLSVY